MSSPSEATQTDHTPCMWATPKLWYGLAGFWLAIGAVSYGSMIRFWLFASIETPPGSMGPIFFPFGELLWLWLFPGALVVNFFVAMEYRQGIHARMLGATLLALLGTLLSTGIETPLALIGRPMVAVAAGMLVIDFLVFLHRLRPPAVIGVGALFTFPTSIALAGWGLLELIGLAKDPYVWITEPAVEASMLLVAGYLFLRCRLAAQRPSADHSETEK